jgi:hypothetical protein
MKLLAFFGIRFSVIKKNSMENYFSVKQIYFCRSDVDFWGAIPVTLAS